MNELAQYVQKHGSFTKGLLLTLLISILAGILAILPLFSIIGQLVLAIFIGIIWKETIGVPEKLMDGVSYASKSLLRVGVVLLGLKLNIIDIYDSGVNVFLISFINLFVTLTFVFLLARLLKVEKNLALLTACGTAICGAAAVIAISSQIKAKANDTAIAAATVCIIGTIFSLIYTLFVSKIGLSPEHYGLFAGSTLHEIAHVIATAAPTGENSVEMALIAKLTRVALLIPVAIVIAWITRYQHKDAEKSSLPIPWFIFGFLLMSFINTIGVVPDSLVSLLTNVAYVFMGMAMAGLGINVEIRAFKQKGKNSFIASFIGSILLSGLGLLLINLLGY